MINKPVDSEVVSNFAENLIDGKAPSFKTEIETNIAGRKIEKEEKGNISCLLMANFIGNHQENLEKRELKSLHAALENRIHHIKENTTGILAFFRFLLNPYKRNELNQQIYYFKALDDFVKNIIKKMPDEKPPLTMPDLPPYIPSPSPSTGTGSVKRRGDIPVSERTLVEKPQVDEPLIAGLEEEPVEGATAAPPPPPPPPSPSAAPKVDKFKDEPEAPKFKSKMSVKEEGESTEVYEKRLKKEIKEIEDYVKEMEDFLKVPRNLKKREEEHSEKLPPLEIALKDLEAKKARLDANFNAISLADEDETVYLLYQKKDKKGQVDLTVDVPYFSEKQFTALNDKLRAVGRKPISDQLLKKNALNFFDDKIKQYERFNEQTQMLEGEIPEKKKEIEEINRQLTEVRESTFKGLKYEKMLTMLTKREQMLADWQRGLKRRQQEFQPKKQPEIEKKQPSEQIASERELEEIEGYRAIREFKQHQNIQILLAGTTFNDNVVAKEQA